MSTSQDREDEHQREHSRDQLAPKTDDAQEAESIERVEPEE